ncbi:MAG: type II toxin-antitoxin system death-on-curing family toxin [Bacteroidota bacterium]
MQEPRWLTRPIVLELHRRQIAEHGGSLGVRDEGLLDSAPGRPQNKFSYEPDADIATLAAAYGFGIAKNHPFVDGNKRTAFVSLYVFLGLNGYDLDVPEPEVVTTMEGVAAGVVDEPALVDWVRANSAPPPLIERSETSVSARGLLRDHLWT